MNNFKSGLWTEAELIRIGECGSELMPLDRVKNVLKLSRKTPVKMADLFDEGGDAHSIWLRSTYLRELSVRTSVMQQAVNGSSPAIKLALKYMLDLRIDMVLR